MTLVLTSEMVAQVIISIFRRSQEKLKWKFRSHAERWWTNQPSMAMRKSSCKNTPQYLRSCCSPVGQNNTKDFSAQSGGSIGRAVWKWSGKSRFPGAFSALLVNLRRFISLPDLFPLALTNRPWVSEDASILVFLEIIPLQCLHVILCFYLSLSQNKLMKLISLLLYSLFLFSLGRSVLSFSKFHCCRDLRKSLTVMENFSRHKLRKEISINQPRLLRNFSCGTQRVIP